MAETTFETVLDTCKVADRRLEGAVKAGLLGGHSLSSTDNNIALLTGPLGPVICDRLCRMQYLSKAQLSDFETLIYPDIQGKQILREDSPHRHWFSIFDSAVKSLQQEAGLIEDTWFGSKTFHALQQLFSFEEPTQLDDWFDKPATNRFVNRAVYVRLRAMGIMPGPEERFFDAVKSQNDAADAYGVQHNELRKRIYYGLALWRAVLSHWGIQLPEGNKREQSILLLFNTDGITQWMANNQDALNKRFHTRIKLPTSWERDTYRRMQDTPKRLFRPLALRVLFKHARIELWLNGYGSSRKKSRNDGSFNPGDPIVLNKLSNIFVISSGPTRIGPELRRFHNFWQDCASLWKTLPQATRTANGDYSYRPRTHSSIKRELERGKLTIATIALRTMEGAKLLDSVPTPSENARMERINEEYAKLTDEERKPETWLEKGKGLVATVFDGIKRVTKWFWSKVKSVFSTLTEVLKKVIRMTKFLATRAYGYFQQLVTVLDTGMTVFTRRVIDGQNGVKIIRDKDFDFTILADTHKAGEDVERSVAVVTHKVTLFRAACIIIRFFYEGVKVVLSLLAGQAFKVVDVLLGLANFAHAMSDEDKQSLALAFKQA